MTRMLRLLTAAAVVEMIVVHVAVVSARGVSLSTLADLSPFETRVVFGLAFFPPWIVLALVAQRWELAGEPSREHRRFKQWGMVGAILFNVACHNMLALGLTQAPLIDVSPTTLAWAFAGVLTMVYGNYRPRTPQPMRPGAASAARWARASLRNGWAMVLLGAAEIVCALAFTGKPLMFAVVLMAPVAIGIAASEWRLLRPAEGRPA